MKVQIRIERMKKSNRKAYAGFPDTETHTFNRYGLADGDHSEEGLKYRRCFEAFSARMYKKHGGNLKSIGIIQNNMLDQDTCKIEFSAVLYQK